jgi:hypothetical protein
MGNTLYILAIVLIIIWLIGFFGFNAGELIHLLIGVAIIIILFRIVSGKTSVE